MTRSVPTRLLALLPALLALSPALAQADSLHRTGPPEDRLDLVILGDGFKSNEEADFDREAARVWAEMTRTEPFASYQGLMNVSTGFRASSRSGPGENNAYGSHFPKFFGSLILAKRASLVLADAVRAGGGEADVVLVVVKSNRRGGTATGNVCYVTTGAGPRVAIHELGHSVARLGDEYSGLSGTPRLTREQMASIYPNLTTKSNRSELPWKDWVAADTRVPGSFFTRGVGAFKGGGAYSSGLYRPKNRCRMRTDGPGFCEVCRQHLVLAFHEGSNPLRLVLSGSGSARRARLEGALPSGRWAARWSGVQATGLEALVPAGTSASVVIEDATTWVRGDLRAGVRYRFDAATGSGGLVGGSGRIAQVTGVTSRLRVRAQPNTSSAIVGHLPPNATVRVVGPVRGGFYPVSFNGAVGYVGQSFLRLSTTSNVGINASLGRVTR